MNTTKKRTGGVRQGLGLGLLALLALLIAVVATACADPEPADPSALIPDWRTYYNREVGVEFKHPYNLKLEVDTLADGQLSAELLWVGSEASVFKLETRDYLVPDEGRGSVTVGGKQGSQYEEQVDGETVQQTKVVHRGRVFIFTGKGSTFDKVLDSVKFLE